MSGLKGSDADEPRTDARALGTEGHVVDADVAPEADAPLGDELDHVPRARREPHDAIARHGRETDDRPFLDVRQRDGGPVPDVAAGARLPPHVRRFVAAAVAPVLLDHAGHQLADVRPVHVVEEANLQRCFFM